MKERAPNIGGSILTVDSRSTRRKTLARCYFAHSESHMGWSPDFLL